MSQNKWSHQVFNPVILTHLFLSAVSSHQNQPNPSVSASLDLNDPNFLAGSGVSNKLTFSSYLRAGASGRRRSRGAPGGDLQRPPVHDCSRYRCEGRGGPGCFSVATCEHTFWLGNTCPSNVNGICPAANTVRLERRGTNERSAWFNNSRECDVICILFVLINL